MKAKDAQIGKNYKIIGTNKVCTVQDIVFIDGVCTRVRVKVDGLSVDISGESELEEVTSIQEAVITQSEETNEPKEQSLLPMRDRIDNKLSIRKFVFNVLDSRPDISRDDLKQMLMNNFSLDEKEAHRKVVFYSNQYKRIKK